MCVCVTFLSGLTRTDFNTHRLMINQWKTSVDARVFTRVNNALDSIRVIAH